MFFRKDDSHENLISIKEISGRSKNLRTKALHDCCEFDALLELGKLCTCCVHVHVQHVYLNSKVIILYLICTCVGLYVDQQDKIAKDAQTFYGSGDMYHFDDAERFFLTSCIALW